MRSPAYAPRRLRAALAGLALVLLAALLAGPAVQSASAGEGWWDPNDGPSAKRAPGGTAPAPPPGPGIHLTVPQAVGIAEREKVVREARDDHSDLRRRAAPPCPPKACPRVSELTWVIDYFSGERWSASVAIDDRTGRVIYARSGPALTWPMIRQDKGKFGRMVVKPWVWIPLTVIFLGIFFDPRRPFRALHFDLAVMASLAISHVYFQRGEPFTMVPLIYPVLGYLTLRMLWVGFRPRTGRGPLVPLLPTTALAVILVALLAGRIVMNVVDSDVMDVGWRGAIGADRILEGKSPYQGIELYGPAMYVAYVPFALAFPFDQSTEAVGNSFFDADVPGAALARGDLRSVHAAAMTFDLLIVFGLILLGGQLRRGPPGRRLGLALAVGWVAFPYSSWALNNNINDTLVAALVVFALLAIASPLGRGTLVGLGAAAKIAPLTVGPLFLSGRNEPKDRTRGAWARYVLGFALICVLPLLVVLPAGGIPDVLDRTVEHQTVGSWTSPFSIWGQEPSLDPLRDVLRWALVPFGFLLAFFPRRRHERQIAALAAVMLLVAQGTSKYWFYNYVPWWAPLVLIALFVAYSTSEDGEEPEETPTKQREPEPQPALA